MRQFRHVVFVRAGFSIPVLVTLVGGCMLDQAALLPSAAPTADESSDTVQPVVEADRVDPADLDLTGAWSGTLTTLTSRSLDGRGSEPIAGSLPLSISFTDGGLPRSVPIWHASLGTVDEWKLQFVGDSRDHAQLADDTAYTYDAVVSLAQYDRGTARIVVGGVARASQGTCTDEGELTQDFDARIDAGELIVRFTGRFEGRAACLPSEASTFTDAELLETTIWEGRLRRSAQ